MFALKNIDRGDKAPWLADLEFSFDTPTWPAVWALQQLALPLQRLIDRLRDTGMLMPAKLTSDQQRILEVAARAEAVMQFSSSIEIPTDWPRDTRQGFLDFWGASCLARANQFLQTVHSGMRFALRDVMTFDSQGGMMGIKQDVDRWGHPVLVEAVRQAFDQLYEKVYSRLSHRALQDVIYQFLFRLEDEVLAWQSSAGTSATSSAEPSLTIADQALQLIQDAYPGWITSSQIGDRIGKPAGSVRSALSQSAKRMGDKRPYESDESGKQLGYRWKK